MKTATVRELRHHFGNVLNWVEQGEPVEIRKRGKAVAVLAPPPPRKPRKVQWPDIMARLKSYCGERVLSDAEVRRILDESRGDARLS